MNYEIKGGSLPFLSVKLEENEEIICQAGAMAWMDDEIEMMTEAGGFRKMIGRAFTSEPMFTNRYVANKAGEIALTSTFPGSIVAVEVTPDKPLIIQKKAFLAMTKGVTSKVYFQKKIGVGLFGGEGFIMNQFIGQGIVFIEVDGSAQEYDIEEGDRKIVNTCNLVAITSTCDLDIRMIKGVKNILFGREGMFNTVVSGPGHLILQSMPIQDTALRLYNYMPHPSSNNN
jgi:uncharacterized protein (TIGR00266 family)